MLDAHKRQLERTFNYAGAVKLGDVLPPFAMTTAYGELVTLESLLSEGPVVLAYIRGDWCNFCNNELHKLNEALHQIQHRKARLVVVSAQKRTANHKLITKLALKFDILQDKNLACKNCSLPTGDFHPLSQSFRSSFFSSSFYPDAKKLGIVVTLSKELAYIYEAEFSADFSTYDALSDPLDGDFERDRIFDHEQDEQVFDADRYPAILTPSSSGSGSGSGGSSSSGSNRVAIATSPRRPSVGRKFSASEIDNRDVELPLTITLVISQDGVVKYAYVSTDFTMRAPVSEVLEVLGSLTMQGSSRQPFDITPPRTPEPLESHGENLRSV